MRLQASVSTLGPFRLLLAVLVLTSSAAEAQQPAEPPTLDPIHAAKLAELMCRQLPNVGTILEMIQVPYTIPPAKEPAKEPFVMDDVYDTLIRLGRYSLPCLVDRLTDARWMPDPREEPLLGVPVVGDVAYMILTDKGVADVLPALAHMKPDKIRMDDYFLWPSVGDHRLRLQAAVRMWLRTHRDCCTAAPTLWKSTLAVPKFRMSGTELAKVRSRFSRLRPGMSTASVLNIAGEPDAIDRGQGSQDENSPSGSQDIGLLGFCANDHNENLAYIYFIERWADDIARRDPLHDRYVILFFSAEGKFTRMFSNVATIDPIFPSSEKDWQRLMWGEALKKQ